MEKCTPHGKPSSRLIRSRPEAAKLLAHSLADKEVSYRLEVLSEHADLYLVGGMVRDAFLGCELKDLDLAMSLTPDKAMSLLEEKSVRAIGTGIEHGTITIPAGDHSIEFTTFRKPSSRHQTEYGTSIEEDLSGRDFTINAIAFDPFKEEFIDPFDGIKHIEEGVLKAVGDPKERFLEDPLRMLRMIRFGPAQGRTVDTETFSVVGELAESLKSVSVERIREELLRILSSEFPHEGIRALLDTRLLPVVIPELVPSVGMEQNEWHFHDVFEHTLWVLERSEDDLLLRVACLLHDIGKPDTLTVDEDGNRHFYNHEHVGAEMAEQFLARLKFSKKDTKVVTSLVKHHMRPLDCGPAGVRRIMRDLGEEFDRWLLIKRADAPPVMPEEEFEQLYGEFLELVKSERERLAGPAYGKLALSGADLLQLGYSEGPHIGEALSRCEDAVIEDPEKNNRDTLLKIAKECLVENSAS